MFGKKFWQRAINFEALAEEGTISPDDTDLITFVDSAREGWDVIEKFYGLGEHKKKMNVKRSMEPVDDWGCIFYKPHKVLCAGWF